MPPAPRKFVSVLIIALQAAALLAACAPLQPRPEAAPSRLPSPFSAPWAYANLRLLDPADSTLPELDLLAVYIRRVGQEVQVRLDLLEMTARPEFDLYLALDTAPGGGGALPIHAEAGITWDTLLVIPAAGPLRALPAGGASGPAAPRAGMALRVLRNPIQDTIEISLRQSGLAEAAYGAPDFGFSVQVFLTPAGSQEPADILGPARSDGPLPSRAPVLLAFWDALPAYSPAQTLRRWDGAHTGPLGGRHGLFNLLRAARATHTPLALLDLKAPASLTALDYAGGVDLVKGMAAEGLLILPQPLPGAGPGSGLLAAQPGWAIERALAEGRQQERLAGLRASPFLFAADGSEIDGSRARVVFVPQPAAGTLAPVGLSRRQGRTLMPIPYEPPSDQAAPQASSEGPTVEVKRSLIEAALSASPEGRLGDSPILVLGGDLPRSTWGEPRSAHATLRYLASHPWVRLLGADELLAARPAETSNANPPNALPSPPLSPLLPSSNPIHQAAWQAYLSLNSPTYPASPELPALRTAYLGQVGALLTAADWAEANQLTCAGEDCAAQQSVDCSADPDGDGQMECILASESFFALLELDGGSLAYAFSRGADGPHQIIAPSSQFVTGQSDPSTWDLGRGLAADPAVIPGAFAGPAGRYTPSVEGGQLILAAPDGSLRKVFRLTSQGLRVEYHYTPGASALQTVQIPLALDPWLRFSPGWADRYSGGETARGWGWRVQGGVQVEVLSSAKLAFYTFGDSRGAFAAPEDPNEDYPPGHALPFPLALVEVAAPGDFDVQINVSP